MKYDQWMDIATCEYGRVFALLRDLDENEWNSLTDCDPWTVRDVVAHLDGAAAATASIREQLRQQRAGQNVQAGRERMEAVNAVQIMERSSLSNRDLVENLKGNAQRGLKARASLPAVLRRLRMPFPAPLGWATLGYLQGAIYTRDPWMHRIDITRATGRDLELTAEHDGAIVADLVEAWTGGRPVDLNLTGPAGAHVGAGSSSPVDAIDFARALAGRGSVAGVDAMPSLF